MNDPYLYENSNVLRNLLNIHDEKALDLAEAELSRASMMLLYDQGFEDDLDSSQPERHSRAKYCTKDYQPSAHEYLEDNAQK